MKKRIAILLVIVLSFTSVISAVFAELDYKTTYETALSLVKNDLTSQDNLKDTIEMLSLLGSYGFAKNYTIFFQQIMDIQSNSPKLDTAKLVIELCQDNHDFSEDLETRGFPSCSVLLAYIDARDQEEKGNLDAACAAYRKMSVLDSPDRALNLVILIANATVAPTEKPTPTPKPTPTSSPKPTATPYPVAIGGIVQFGHYEQDGKKSNGAEPIEWLVLDYDAANHRVLLLSRYGLDTRPYNKESVGITWEKCTLRAWLNGEFMSSAFSTIEQGAILTTSVDNSKSQGLSRWDTNGGNNTQDKIFLLSYAQAYKYLGVTWEDGNNTKSRVSPTAYALKQGAWRTDFYKTADGAAAGWWWLRSPGSSQYYAAFVRDDGSLGHYYVSRGSGCVRPALWINLESDIF